MWFEIIIAKTDSGGWSSFAKFFLIIWTLVALGIFKAKVFLVGAIVAVTGVFFPTKVDHRALPKPERVEGGKWYLSFAGSLRGLLVFGGILIAIVGIIVDGKHFSEAGKKASQIWKGGDADAAPTSGEPIKLPPD